MRRERRARCARTPMSAERQIDVEWARSTNEAFPVKMVVYTDDRPGMLNELTSILFHESSNIRSLEAKGATDHDGGHLSETVATRSG